MSDFQGELEKLRENGSLRYLASHLGVTPKQVTRYWDAKLIEGRYRTPKGHRRIRYTDDTVEHVKLVVAAVKQNNNRIRYHVQEIDYCGTIVPVNGCTSAQGRYKQALKAGLNKREARMLASMLFSKPASSKEDTIWGFIHTLEGISENEVMMNYREFAEVPFLQLLSMEDPEDFRAAAKEILSKIETKRKGLAPLSANIRKLLSQNDRQSFWELGTKMMEIRDRVSADASDDEDERSHGNIYRRLASSPDNELRNFILPTLAMQLKHRGLRPSASELARLVGLSRPALYREYGARLIQEALNSVRNSPSAINETSEEGRLKRNKPKKVAKHDNDCGTRYP